MRRGKVIRLPRSCACEAYPFCEHAQNAAPAPTKPNTTTHVQIVLGTLSGEVKRVLWAIKSSTPITGVSERELTELFTKGIMRQDWDVLGKREVVLLTSLGKRCLDILPAPIPPDPPRPPGKKAKAA